MIFINQLGKIKSSEFAEAVKRGYVAYLGGFYGVIKCSEINLSSINHDLRSILDTRHPHISACICGKTGAVPAILFLSGWSEIIALMIESIPVDVINSYFTRNPENEISQSSVGLLTIDPLQSCGGNGEPASSGCLYSHPINAYHSVIIYGVNFCNLPLGKWDKFNQGIARLSDFGAGHIPPFWFLFQRDNTDTARLRIADFLYSTVWACVILPRIFRFLGRLKSRFSHLCQQGAHRLPPVSAGWTALGRV